MHRHKEDVMDYVGERVERVSRDRLVPPIRWRLVAQRITVGVCLVVFSAVFFVGAITIIRWLL